MGQSGGYENTIGCTYSSSINSTQWDNSITNFDDGYGFGVGLYFIEGGPGADPIYYSDYEHGFVPPTYTYTSTDAYNWGYSQGQYAVNLFDFYNDYYPSVIMPIVFLDAEYDYGWNEVLADTTAPSCGEIVSASSCCTAALDRETFDGFTDAVTASGLTKGAYSSYDFWNLTTFACGSCTSGDGYIPNTDQWTAGTTGANGPADPGDSPVPGQDGASAWCIHNTPNDNCAGWFGDVDSGHQVAWQWSEKGWSGNGVADFDQWYESGMDGS
jgi:hypothetical protein